MKIFARYLLLENVSFHPDDDFNGYVNIKTKKSTYMKKEADLGNTFVKSCFWVFENEGVDVYEVMYEIKLAENVVAM